MKFRGLYASVVNIVQHRPAKFGEQRFRKCLDAVKIEHHKSQQIKG